ncbi:hypothetical protein KOEU_24620 [Komagataeibacter europaeus]|uniref:Uncharacterized protein n=1 Tax=Komagataeibacter europaeus TaxID=33995 RepID=A0A0M0EFF1_KOMEU|nr:hypothetical protein KOEU_24620 [Komagataeibacter europaeus]
MRGQTGHTSRRLWRPAQHTRSGDNQNDGVILPPYRQPNRPVPGQYLAGHARLSQLRSACGQSERQSGCFNRRTVSASERRIRASPLLIPRLSMRKADRQVPASCLPADCRADCQTRAMLPLAGSGGAMPVKRTNAVMPTAIAPITEKKSCQAADGIIIWARPWVALKPAMTAGTV